MFVAILVIAIVVSIGVSIFRAKNIIKMREEEKRQREEKLKRLQRDEHIERLQREYDRRQNASPTADTPAAPPQPERPPFADGDPFAAYRSENTGTLSPAQYNEWMLDFVSAERANYPRPAPSGVLAPFARYLGQSAFCFADLYKQSYDGKTVIAPKRVGDALGTQRFAPLPLPRKRADNAAVFTAFYKNKD